MTTPPDSTDVAREVPSIVSQELQEADINSLIPHPDNPRRGDIGAITESLHANGWYGACLVQRSTNFILAGEHRWTAAKDIGSKTVPAIFIDVDDETARRIVLVDNRSNDVADYDNKVLGLVLQQVRLEATSLVGTGYCNADLDQILTTLKEVQSAATGGHSAKSKKEKPATFVIGPFKIPVGRETVVAWFKAMKEQLQTTDDAAIVAEIKRRLGL